MNSFTIVHRKQRAEARRLASEKYPLIKVPYLWGAGTKYEHWVTQYKEHPLYLGEYFNQFLIYEGLTDSLWILAIKNNQSKEV